jgi:hypothetical protein
LNSFMLQMCFNTINLGYVLQYCYNSITNRIAGDWAGFVTVPVQFFLVSVLKRLEIVPSEKRPSPVFMETGIERAGMVNWLGLGRHTQSAYRQCGSARCELVAGTWFASFPIIRLKLLRANEAQFSWLKTGGYGGFSVQN